MASFGSGFIIIRKSWTDLKAIIELKQLTMQYDESEEIYEIFSIDNPIVYLCTIFKGIIPGVTEDVQEQNGTEKNDFEINYKNNCNEPAYIIDRNRIRMVEVNYRKDECHNGDYYLLIDLDNPDGYYLHTNGYNIKIGGMTSFSIKSDMSDLWSVRFGTILYIDSELSKIGWLRPGTTSIRDTSKNQYEYDDFAFPLLIDCSVLDGKYKKIASNHDEIVYDLNTTSLIKDINDIYRTPQVGDCIIKTVRWEGTGTILFHYHVWYFVE